MALEEIWVAQWVVVWGPLGVWRGPWGGSWWQPFTVSHWSTAPFHFGVRHLWDMGMMSYSLVFLSLTKILHISDIHIHYSPLRKVCCSMNFTLKEFCRSPEMCWQGEEACWIPETCWKKEEMHITGVKPTLTWWNKGRVTWWSKNQNHNFWVLQNIIIIPLYVGKFIVIISREMCYYSGMLTILCPVWALINFMHNQVSGNVPSGKGCGC